MPTLDEQVASLEQRFAELEAATLADTISPNYLTVNPNGTVGANFTGHVAAAGVDLPAGVSASPPSDSRVRWLSQTDGAVLADLTAFTSGQRLLAQSVYAPDNDQAGIWLDARDATNNSAAGIHLVSSPGANPNGYIDINAGTKLIGGYEFPAQQRRIIDSNGVSNFLQLPGAANLQLQLGTLAFNLAANAWAGFVQSFPALFTGPVYVVFSPAVSVGANNTFFAELVTVRDDAFQINAYCTVPANGQFYWLALGQI